MTSETKDYGFVSAYDLKKEEGKYGFIPQHPSTEQENDEGFLGSLKSYGKSALKGGIEGISALGRMMGPLEGGASTEDQLADQSEILNQLLPTEDSFGEKSLRRGLKMAPSMMAFPGNSVQAGLRSLGAGLAGETAKELDLPEWAQTASELTAFIGPDLTKKLLESGKNEKLIKFAKKMGMTEKEITPLIQSEFKQKWLTKLTPKRGSTEKALSETKKALDASYGTLQKSEEAAQSLPFNETEKFQDKISEILFKMPSAVRNKIKEDLSDLYSSPITGESLINFYTDVNHYLSDNAKQLSLLKQPVKDALASISPNLGKDFEMVNQLYTKYHPIAARLKPNLMSDIISAGEALGIGVGSIGIMFGMYPPMLTILGKAGTNKLAQKLLLSPHLQQLSKKMANALNQNKFGIAKKLAESFGNQIEKFSPKAAEQLQNISEKDLEDLFNHKEKDRMQSK